MRRPRRLLPAAAIVVALVSAACTSSPGATPATTGGGTTEPGGPSTTRPTSQELQLDPRSHTTPALPSIADFEALATTGVGAQSVLKFSITEFTTAPEIVWLDSAFYTLHDEWYWWQLLNGDAVRGFDTSPVEWPDEAPADDEQRFATVGEAYAWADANRRSLPLDLRFTTLDRLYSSHFYDVARDASPDRRVGLGALIRMPDPGDGRDRWLIELEYSDDVTAAQMEVYFDLVTSSVPGEIGDSLAWVPRSRHQELVADSIERSDGPGRDRIVRYDELTTPGETQVYSSGIAAGRLLLVVDGGRWSLSDADHDDIVAIDVAPDDLPPGNGLITGTPQTPLAHVNVLALNRGIPNAHLAGLADDPTLAQLGRVRAPVLVRATADGELDVFALSDEEYAGWQAVLGRAPISVPTVDVSALDHVIGLDGLDPRRVDDLRSTIGGKASGFVALSAPGTVTVPPDAMALSVRPYVEHAERMTAQIDAVLDHADSAASSIRSRYLALEGRDDFDARFDSERDAEFADGFEAAHPIGSPLGDVLAAGGLRRMFRSVPIDPATLDTITAALRENFASYSPTQGLRFRSSSTVEDIEGFNGAGLYDSNTGFLDPADLPDPDDHDRTVERAILRTWASYWSATAFEERRRENVDHRSGAMAVLVHARFDDELELSNGVATFTVRPDPETAASMEINVQIGATSVTNAVASDDALPDVVRLVQTEEDGPVEIVRLGASTITDGTPILDDAQLLELFRQIGDVAQHWLATENVGLPPDRRSSTVTIDVEFRRMDVGWPAHGDGRVEPSRMVVKQARALGPGLRGVPTELIDMAIPRDVLAHAGSVVVLECPDGLTGVRIRTDAFAHIDLGYAEQPFVRWISATFTSEVPPPSLDQSRCRQRNALTSPQQYLVDLLADR